MEDDPNLRRRTSSKLAPVPNPFFNSGPWSCYEICKCAIVSCVLLPMRLFLLFWCCVYMVIVARIAVWGTSLTQEKGCMFHPKPFSWWRRLLMLPLAPLNRIGLMCFGYWPGAIKVRDHRKGKTKANVLVVAPHTTFIDSLMVAVAFPPVPSGVGMSGLLNLPVMKDLSIAGQGVFMDRANAESRQRCKEAIQFRSSAEWSGPPMMIFPEGVITNGDVLIHFKVGAFSAGEPVTPVCLRYPWKHYNPSPCGKNGSMVMALLRTLLQFKNVCHIDILDTYIPSAAEKQDASLFAHNVRLAMAAHMKLPLTEHSYDDAILANASRAHVGLDFEVKTMESLYSYSFEDLSSLLRSFEKHDVKNTGAISCSEFKKAFLSAGVDTKGSDLSAERLFAFIDQDHSGGIEYREFVQIAALLSGRCSMVSRARLAFLIYDTRGAGKVKRGLLRKALNDSVAHPGVEMPQGGSASSSPGQLLAGDDEDELDMEEFVQLVQSQPEVLEAGLELLRERLCLPSLGHPSPRSKEE